MSFVDVGGLRLNCVEWGRGDITVVFIHGNLACADWFRLAASLLPERFRIVAIDWRDVVGAEGSVLHGGLEGKEDSLVG